MYHTNEVTLLLEQQNIDVDDETQFLERYMDMRSEETIEAEYASEYEDLYENEEEND